MSFNYLIERQNQLLNDQTASTIFSYLNKLEGLNKTFILNISKIQFIPLQGNKQIKTFLFYFLFLFRKYLFN